MTTGRSTITATIAATIDSWTQSLLNLVKTVSMLTLTCPQTSKHLIVMNLMILDLREDICVLSLTSLYLSQSRAKSRELRTDVLKPCPHLYLKVAEARRQVVHPLKHRVKEVRRNSLTLS